MVRLTKEAARKLGQMRWPEVRLLTTPATRRHLCIAALDIADWMIERDPARAERWAYEDVSCSIFVENHAQPLNRSERRNARRLERLRSRRYAKSRSRRS